jgi:ribosomal protein S21
VVVPAAVASAAEGKITDIEKAIGVLKRKIQRNGIFRELKNRRFYEKPSIKKTRKRIEAQETETEDPAYEQTGRRVPYRNPILGLWTGN